MKLVKIKDVRVGQVWKDTYNGFIRVVIPFDDEPNVICGNSLFYPCNNEILLRDDFEDIILEDIKSRHKLIGFIGITHKIEDEKLVEIPREDFEVDDVVKTSTKNIQIIDRVIDGYMVHLLGYDYSFYEEKEELNKIGIFGITHEFVNERLVK